jgi:hypothetical protein
MLDTGIREEKKKPKVEDGIRAKVEDGIRAPEVKDGRRQLEVDNGRTELDRGWEDGARCGGWKV